MITFVISYTIPPTRMMHYWEMDCKDEQEARDMFAAQEPRGKLLTIESMSDILRKTVLKNLLQGLDDLDGKDAVVELDAYVDYVVKEAVKGK